MSHNPLFYLIPIFLLCMCGYAAEDAAQQSSVNGIQVDLREPVYSEGTLSTDKGGVITGPDLRIQAKNISYTRKNEKGACVHSLIAEGDLTIEFGDYILVGQRLEYDFNENTGLVYDGRTMVEPWYMGGETIRLCSDGSYVIYNAFITTSENRITSWQISSKEATLREGRLLNAKDVQFRFFKIPLLWVPSFNANLDSIFDAPIRYYFKWGGKQGPRLGFSYEIFSWNRFKSFARLDYRFKRGPGGGIETYYRSADHKTIFQTINYAAYDNSLTRLSERKRYRFQGFYGTKLDNDKITLELSYDKLSDKDMASDYKDSGLDIEIAERSQLCIRRIERDWIGSFFVSPRLNNFQTIKQQLPAFENSWRPFTWGETGIISENQFSASYLDFEYSNSLINVHDYSSTRVELSTCSYRPFRYRQFNIMPEVAGIGIFYGNSPSHNPKWLAIGKMGCGVNTRLFRQYSNFRHVITPYANYEYYTYPTVSPNDHYIFDIDDGWYRLNQLKLGITQSLNFKNCDGWMNRSLYADLYAYAFFDTKTIPQTIPKVYAQVIYYSSPFVRHTLDTAWDFYENQLDHYNFRTEWTVNADLAIAAEYRHRDAFAWRKVDYSNFILDSFRTISQLRHSSLSDRRDTLLLHFFYRFHPNWAVEFESRHGWNRRTEPSYTEYEIDLLATLPSAWNLKMSYQHYEREDRIAFYISVGIKKPDQAKYCQLIPKLEF